MDAIELADIFRIARHLSREVVNFFHAVDRALDDVFVQNRAFHNIDLRSRTTCSHEHADFTIYETRQKVRAQKSGRAGDERFSHLLFRR